MGVIEPGDAATAVLPEQFGKYSLLGHLATGGMAEIREKNLPGSLNDGRAEAKEPKSKATAKNSG